MKALGGGFKGLANLGGDAFKGAANLGGGMVGGAMNMGGGALMKGFGTPLNMMTAWVPDANMMEKNIQKDEHGHITAYDAQLLGQWGIFYMAKGTFLQSMFIWRQAAIFLAVQFGLAILCYSLYVLFAYSQCFVSAIAVRACSSLTRLRYVLSSFSHRWDDPDQIPVDVVEQVALITSGLIGFFLSLFVQLSVERWWTMREKSLGGLIAAIDRINLLLTLYHRNGSEYDEWLLDTYGRLSLACHELVYVVAGDHEDSKLPHQFDLNSLIERGQLNENEVEQLRDVKNKAMVVWFWACALTNDYAIIPKQAKQELHCAHEAGRGSIQSIFTFVETSLPITYTHIVIFIVKFNMFIVAAQAGLISGRELILNGYSTIAVQAFIVIMLPAVYQGLVSMERNLKNPFGGDMIDFPKGAYRIVMKKRHDEYRAAMRSLPYRHHRYTPVPAGIIPTEWDKMGTHKVGR
jgi:hypothetical protein